MHCSLTSTSRFSFIVLFFNDSQLISFGVRLRLASWTKNTAVKRISYFFFFLAFVRLMANSLARSFALQSNTKTYSRLRKFYWNCFGHLSISSVKHQWNFFLKRERKNNAYVVRFFIKLIRVLCFVCSRVCAFASHSYINTWMRRLFLHVCVCVCLHIFFSTSSWLLYTITLYGMLCGR